MGSLASLTRAGCLCPVPADFQGHRYYVRRCLGDRPGDGTFFRRRDWRRRYGIGRNDPYPRFSMGTAVDGHCCCDVRHRLLGGLVLAVAGSKTQRKIPRYRSRYEIAGTLNGVVTVKPLSSLFICAKMVKIKKTPFGEGGIFFEEISFRPD